VTSATVPRAAVALVPSGPLGGRLEAPPSKSVTNRLLVLAALAPGQSRLHRPLASDDSAAMQSVLAALGVPIERADDALAVSGQGGRLRPQAAEADARLSGTTMRFGAALATLATTPVTVTGQPPLLRRPIGPLVTALRVLGGAVSDRGGFPPVHAAGGGLAGGAVTVDAAASSQFASAVLLVAPCAAADVHVTAAGLAAAAYVDLTVAEMRAWGAEVEQRAATSWSVRAGQGYEPRAVTVEYDASAACHLYALAVATGGSVTVTNAAAGSIQPDAALPEVLAAMGAQVRRTGDAVTISGPDVVRPVTVDLHAMPDQVTTVAALAALADGESEVRGVAVARGHETDRLAALATELGKLGVPVRQLRDGLRIRGGAARGPARLDTYDDHRLAMAFAAVGAAVPDVVIAEPWCVTKTYPGFWQDARALGLDWHEVP
jgi:3-phosphoshikimate 1-carboxyvinyltransferase